MTSVENRKKTFAAKLCHPFALLVLFLCLFCGTLGLGWLHESPSDQELTANFSKAIDYLHGAISVKGWPWWTPDFMGGHSLASSMGNILGYFWVLLGAGLLGPFYGPKVIGLLCIAASGLATYVFAKNLLRSEWTGLLCAVFYVTCPQVSLQFAGTEDFAVALCFPYPPLILWALTKIAETASWRNSVLFAMALGAMFLTFAKLTVVFLPVVTGFAMWLYITRSEIRRNLRAGLLRAAGPIVLLGVLPLLPSLREVQWMALFSSDPFEGWQRSFSMKTALSWFDRGGSLMAGAPAYFTVDQGGFYLGAIAILAFVVFFLWKRETWLQSANGRMCRVFIGLALLLHWLSFGPRSIIAGHREFLGVAQGVQNWVLPIFWFALVAQVRIIVRLWPECRWRGFWIALSLLVYLFVPGFQIIQHIPGFGQIRSPWSFWQPGASFCISMAAGIATATCLRHAAGQPPARYFRSRFARAGLAILVLSFGFADLSVYHGRFFGSALPGGTFSDFKGAQNFLMRAQRPGSVYALSSRYFYLMTPFLSRRTLSMESFDSYCMERWSRIVTDSGLRAPDLLKTYLNVDGISFMLVDKQDPNLPEELQKHYRENFTVAYENPHFLILENTGSFAPAFLAREFIPMPPESYPLVGQMLGYAEFNFLSVETPPDSSKECAGILNGNGEIEIKPEYKEHGGTPFRKVTMGPAEWRELRKDFHRIEFPMMDQQGGWLVMCEAYHPDWKAYAAGRQIPVRRGMGSLLAVPLPERPATVLLQFEPPWWYSASASFSLVTWLACGGFLLAGLLGPESWRLKWSQPNELNSNETKIEMSPIPCKPVEKSIVIIPTYNEAKNLPELFERLFKLPPGVDMLIVDDNSPDGTANSVKQHAEFNRRLFLMERTGKQGLATAYKQGFQWALQRGYDACLEMDADLSHDPADIPRLLATLNEGADIAIGSRYLNGIRVLNWPANRLQLSLFAGFYTRRLAGLPLSDPTSGFKAIRREVLESFDWSRFIAAGYGFQIEIHFYAWRNGFRLHEVPIVFTERNEGRSKMSWQISAEAAWRVLRLVPERFKPFGATRTGKPGNKV